MILFPFWFTIVLLIANAIIVSRMEIIVEEENNPTEDHE